VRIRVKNSKDNRDNVRFPLVLVLNFEVLMPNQLSTRSGCGARASKFYTALILGALDGRWKERILSPDFCQGSLFTPQIREVADGSYKQKNAPAIAGTGYVVRSLEAALWAFHRSDTFKAGALLAANGDDSDTVAAVYGQLAGPFMPRRQFRLPGWRS